MTDLGLSNGIKAKKNACVVRTQTHNTSCNRDKMPCRNPFVPLLFGSLPHFTYICMILEQKIGT